MSALRHSILAAIAAAWPQPATMAQLRAATGLTNAVLSEHIRALRWRGLVMFDRLLPSPSVLAEFRPATPTAGTAPVIEASAHASITGKPRQRVLIDLNKVPSAMEQLADSWRRER